MKKYFERDKGIIHCEGADGNDYTLCGFSLDGDQAEIEEVTTGKISCLDCIGVIRFAKSIPARALLRK